MTTIKSLGDFGTTSEMRQKVIAVGVLQLSQLIRILPEVTSDTDMSSNWERDVIQDKKTMAIHFINSIRFMEPPHLNALIAREAGEDLAQFFLSYSSNLISRDPEKVLENTSSLMLMGYLIRAYEERKKAEQIGARA